LIKENLPWVQYYIVVTLKNMMMLIHSVK